MISQTTKRATTPRQTQPSRLDDCAPRRRSLPERYGERLARAEGPGRHVGQGWFQCRLDGVDDFRKGRIELLLISTVSSRRLTSASRVGDRKLLFANQQFSGSICKCPGFLQIST